MRKWLSRKIFAWMFPAAYTAINHWRFQITTDPISGRQDPNRQGRKQLAEELMDSL